MRKRTQKVKAAGFVTFVKEGEDYKVLLLDHGQHISHPKGHIDGNESKLECAHRELKEETNLEMDIHSSSPIHTKKYTIPKISKQIEKTVYLYAGIAKNGDISISNEHRRYLLLDAYSRQAMDTLTYTEDRDSLSFALKWLDVNKLG